MNVKKYSHEVYYRIIDRQGGFVYYRKQNAQPAQQLKHCRGGIQSSIPACADAIGRDAPGLLLLNTTI